MTNINIDLSAVQAAAAKEKNLGSLGNLIRELENCVVAARRDAMELLLNENKSLSLNEIAFELGMENYEVANELINSGRLAHFQEVDAVERYWERAQSESVSDLEYYVDMSIFDRKLEREGDGERYTFGVDEDDDAFPRNGFDPDETEARIGRCDSPYDEMNG